MLEYSTHAALPLRRNFEDFATDATALNLYLLALSRTQGVLQSDPTSYFQIAGIHGRPYTAWDGVSGGNNNGGRIQLRCITRA